MLLMDQMMNLMEKFFQELKEAEPEKRDHFINGTLKLFDVTAEALRTSPEFRRGFGMVHSEFLKYPESRETILQSIDSYEKYGQPSHVGDDR